VSERSERPERSERFQPDEALFTRDALCAPRLTDALDRFVTPSSTSSGISSDAAWLWLTRDTRAKEAGSPLAKSRG
jgi:hypothetical protein